MSSNPLPSTNESQRTFGSVRLKLSVRFTSFLEKGLLQLKNDKARGYEKAELLLALSPKPPLRPTPTLRVRRSQSSIA